MIASIVLSAGLSSRMGQSKPLLPFGERTVIEHIISVLQECPVEEILIVSGHQYKAVEHCLSGWPARLVFNPDYATGEMLSSIQIGLQTASPDVDAALIVLGDQPALERAVVDKIIATYREGRGSIVIPSYQMRRGHPFLIDRKHWKGILALGSEQTLRDFLLGVGREIHHVEVMTPSVLQDMDTPADYQRELAEHLSRRQT